MAGPTSAPTSAPAAASAAPSVSHGPVERAARPIEGLAGNGKPDYPPAALRRREQGGVVLRVTVGPDGRARAAVVQQSSGHPLLDDAAVAKVLRDWRFAPATRDGVAVTGTVLVPFAFELAN